MCVRKLFTVLQPNNLDNMKYKLYIKQKGSAVSCNFMWKGSIK